MERPCARRPAGWPVWRTSDHVRPASPLIVNTIDLALGGTHDRDGVTGSARIERVEDVVERCPER